MITYDETKWNTWKSYPSLAGAPWNWKPSPLLSCLDPSKPDPYMDWNPWKAQRGGHQVTERRNGSLHKGVCFEPLDFFKWSWHFIYIIYAYIHPKISKNNQVPYSPYQSSGEYIIITSCIDLQIVYILCIYTLSQKGVASLNWRSVFWAWAFLTCAWWCIVWLIVTKREGLLCTSCTNNIPTKQRRTLPWLALGGEGMEKQSLEHVASLCTFPSCLQDIGRTPKKARSVGSHTRSVHQRCNSPALACARCSKRITSVMEV